MSIPLHFSGLVDDAAVFPPGLMPLAEAVAAHAAHLASDHRALVGPFVVTTADLARTAELVDPALHPDGLQVSVVVPTPAAIDETLEVTAGGPLVLAGLEIKLDPAADLAAQLVQIAQAAAGGVPTYVEAPRATDPLWADVLRAATRYRLRLKFRTGGTEAAAFPSEQEVAIWIREAVRAELAFKCTAGLHNAVRHTGAETGFEHHGYLNILLATLTATAGADADELARTLAERDPVPLATALRAAGPAALARARRSFVSYGSCSITEPLEDLAALHLLDQSAPGAAAVDDHDRNRDQEIA